MLEDRDTGTMERGSSSGSEGLWSMLSVTAVVNKPFLRTGGQTTPSSTYLLTVASPSWADIFSTLP